ncbi:MAG: hypothetical protein ACREMO_03170, partial [Gemmatimonadales bacterium]
RGVQLVSLEYQGGLESRLHLIGTGPPELGGLRVTGVLTNHSTSPIHRLRAQLPQGALARLAEGLEPGQVLDVDARFVWPRSIPAGSGLPAEPVERTMFAAASEAFSRPGQVVVSGLLAERAGKVSVMVQPVAYDRVGSTVALAGRAHVVASVQEPAGTRLSVHDVEGVIGIGPLDLSYGLNAPPAELYDWATGAWRPAPAKDPSPRAGNPHLDEGEVHQGTVRIRTKGDPSLFDYTIVPRKG